MHSKHPLFSLKKFKQAIFIESDLQSKTGAMDIFLHRLFWVVSLSPPTFCFHSIRKEHIHPGPEKRPPTGI